MSERTTSILSQRPVMWGDEAIANYSGTSASIRPQDPVQYAAHSLQTYPQPYPAAIPAARQYAANNFATTYDPFNNGFLPTGGDGGSDPFGGGGDGQLFPTPDFGTGPFSGGSDGGYIPASANTGGKSTGSSILDFFKGLFDGVSAGTPDFVSSLLANGSIVVLGILIIAIAIFAFLQSEPAVINAEKAAVAA